MLASAAEAVLPDPVLAQSAYPSRPVRQVVAFPAGGPTDTVARILAERAGRELGQPVVLEHRGGANGNIAADAVAKADPDGYTLLYNTSSIAISRALYKSLGYDLEHDLSPVAQTVAVPAALVVHQALPPRDTGGFIAWAQANSGKVTYSSGSVGNSSHLLAFMVMGHIGAEAVHVPNRGRRGRLPALYQAPHNRGVPRKGEDPSEPGEVGVGHGEARG